MADSTFAERLAYARWLYPLVVGAKSPGNAEIGRHVGRKGQTLTNWMAQADPPPFHDVRKPLAQLLHVEETWLFDNSSEPPRPDLWQDWIARHRDPKRPTYLKVAEQTQHYVAGEEVHRSSSRKRPRKRRRR